MTRPHVMVTGGLGTIGRCLHEGLADTFRLTLLDRTDPGEEIRGAGFVRSDLSDPDELRQAMAGVDVVVHLAAFPVEAPFEQILADNIVTSYTVFETARRAGVRRVVFASSNHATGFQPRDSVVGPDDPPRPDTFYGVSKVTGEALGRLYADKYGLEVVCLRIGSFLDHPTDVRHLSTWLSPRDCRQLVARSVEAPVEGFLVVYGVSGNTRGWWSRSGWHTLGYRPQDDAERYAGEVGPEPDVAPGGLAAAHQGGWFVEWDPTTDPAR